MELERTASESSLQTSGSPLGIYIASFFFAVHDHCTLTALPWRVMGLGGQTLAVGAIGALYLGSYTVFCLLFASRLGKIKPKRQALTSVAIIILLVLAMPLTRHVGVLLALVALKGMVMCAFWPPMMSWVSTGAEGGPLNKRLGIFNLSWCSGAIVGSWLGGTLFTIRPWLPFAAAVGALLVNLTTAAFVPDRTTPKKHQMNTGPSEPEPANLRIFRWVARIGLVSAWMTSAAFRVPIAALIKDMSLGSGLHANLMAGVNFIMMSCFFLLSRSRLWHYRFWAVVAAQFLVTVSLIGVAKAGSAQQLLFFAFIGTPALAFAYSSHLFYTISSAGNRQKNASIHEILLAFGFSIGSFGGGALGQLYGIRSVYFAIAGATLAALAIQTAIFFILKSSLLPKKHST